MILYIMSTLFFALASWLENSRLFYWVCIGSRLFEGVGSANCIVAVYSIICTEFPDSIEQKNIYIIAAEGLATSLGPLLGSSIYSLLGYAGTNLFFTGFFLVLGLLPLYFLPGRIDEKRS